MNNWKPISIQDSSKIYGGGPILTAILTIAPVVISAISALIPIIKAATSKKGEINKTGSVKWDDTSPTSSTTVYKPVYVAY
ncbi:hypothetical protein [Mycoplasmopsis felifaucium]|uniref:Uncharacterized protein n=1 Tax=Mycoplasmopsis felifaucium TaxID=35768 RepID=A0ABZ2RPY3_9BACT